MNIITHYAIIYYFSIKNLLRKKIHVGMIVTLKKDALPIAEFKCGKLNEHIFSTITKSQV